MRQLLLHPIPCRQCGPGKAISAAAKGAAAGGPYGAAIGAALSARKHIGKIAAAALVLLALPLLFILLLPGLAFGSLTDSGASGTHPDSRFSMTMRLLRKT